MAVNWAGLAGIAACILGLFVGKPSIQKQAGRFWQSFMEHFDPPRIYAKTLVPCTQEICRRASTYHFPYQLLYLWSICTQITSPILES